MKFHQLARRSSSSKFYAPQQTQVAPNQHQHRLKRDSPGFVDDTDTDIDIIEDELDIEDEDYAAQATGAHSYDQRISNQDKSVLQQQQQQQMDLTNNEAGNSASFLMDKNKKLFPQKLWELIHNPSIQHCLRWSQDGQRVYLNRNEFETYYLKTANNQFHTQKAISFVRQMNMYGFRKVDDCYYENDNFRRDKQHLLRNMIRRHPNKGLFVGLDQHHQFAAAAAAAAAAQQAIHVNQQFQHQLEQQQLEQQQQQQQFEQQQQHKQRTEQALRLSNYLNSNNNNNNNNNSQQHQIGHSQLMLDSHSSPFEQSLSSQLAQQFAAAAAHQNQFQNHQNHQNHHHHHLNHHTDDNLSLNIETNQQQLNLQQQSQPVHHQPKKSRLLSDFYAATAAAAAAASGNKQLTNSNNNQLILNQDSMHSTSSVDTQPSQCSSVVNSGSAGSPQPSSPPGMHQQQLHRIKQHDGNSASSSMRQVLAPSQPNPSDMATNLSGKLEQQQHSATDLSNHQSRQAALQQTLVRSLLLQLKQQQQEHPRHLLASLAQQQQQQQQHLHQSRSLLESLASLSSAGTGSIVDPTSNSPTERTATPPSGPASPPSMAALDDNCLTDDDDDDAGNRRDAYMVLNLAKTVADTKAFNVLAGGCDKQEVNDQVIGIEKKLDANSKQIDADEERTEIGDDDGDDDHQDVAAGCESAANSPLDGAKKVRRFLDTQMLHRRSLSSNREDEDEQEDEEHEAKNGRSIKRQYSGSDELLDDGKVSSGKNGKRVKMESSNTASCDAAAAAAVAAEELPGMQAKSLIVSLLNRKGIDKLEPQALDEAARYTQCFLNTLLGDAALIAGHSSDDDYSTRADDDEEDSSESEVSSKASVIDSSSLSLALKLIPSKLIAAIQRQQQQQQQQPVAIANKS